MHSRNKSYSNLQNVTLSTEQQQQLLQTAESEFETSNNMSNSSTVLDLGGLTSNWQNSSALTYRMGNSKIRFQKPFTLALLCFTGIVLLLYISFSGFTLRSTSNYSSHYGDTFVSNYAKIEASTFSNQKSNVKIVSYNSTYPLTAPGINFNSDKTGFSSTCFTHSYLMQNKEAMV